MKEFLGLFVFIYILSFTYADHFGHKKAIYINRVSKTPVHIYKKVPYKVPVKIPVLIKPVIKTVKVKVPVKVPYPVKEPYPVKVPVPVKVPFPVQVRYPVAVHVPVPYKQVVKVVEKQPVYIPVKGYEEKHKCCDDDKYSSKYESGQDRSYSYGDSYANQGSYGGSATGYGGSGGGYSSSYGGRLGTINTKHGDTYGRDGYGNDGYDGYETVDSYDGNGRGGYSS